MASPFSSERHLELLDRVGNPRPHRISGGVTNPGMPQGDAVHDYPAAFDCGQGETTHAVPDFHLACVDVHRTFECVGIAEYGLLREDILAALDVACKHLAAEEI